MAVLCDFINVTDDMRSNRFMTTIKDRFLYCSYYGKK